MSLPYRDNVGAVLFNRAGLIFVARRADLPNAEGAPGGWQLPQGGIDKGEDPSIAIFRELEEEIGTARAEIMAEHPDWLTYDLPPELLGKALIPDLPFEQPDGSPYRIDTDDFGRKRDAANPCPGPFELRGGGQQMLKVWPVGSSER